MKPLPLPRRRIILAIAVLALGLVGGVGGSLALSWTRADEAEAVADEAEAERDEAVAAIEDLCEQVEDLGRTCVEDPSDFQGAEGPQGDPGPPPSDEQVLAAVEDYFAQNPVEDGADASPAQIAAAVIAYLTENPPAAGEPGPPPTDAQILTAVTTYLAANPPPAGVDGKDGVDGEPGRAPTAEEILTALETWLAENPIPVCPEGATAEAHTVLTTGGAIDVIVCATHETEE